MCNTYRISQKRGAMGLAQQVNEAAAKLVSDLVRKSDPGIVMRADGRVEVMRWGFHREFNPAINNARSDKLEGGMWKEAFHLGRCVIPMTLFYEWGPGTGGRKQAHDFHDPDDDFLWAAGIWEEHPDIGPCYTMVNFAGRLREIEVPWFKDGARFIGINGESGRDGRGRLVGDLTDILPCKVSRLEP